VSAPVSNEVLGLVWSLFEKRGLLDRVRGHDQRPVILKRIAESRELRVVPALLPLVVLDERLAPEAGRTITALVRDATPVQLAWLDEQLRTWYHGLYWSNAWHTASPEAVSRAAQAPGLQTVVIGLLASHRNGFVRAAVLDVLAQRRDGEEIPFLCLRVNDWVEPVAARASELLASRFRPENRQAVLSALPFVVRVLGARRRNHAQIEQALSAVLLSDGGRDALALAHDIPTTVRRTMYALMTGRETAIPRPVIDAALSDPDAVIRARALGVVAADTEFPNRDGILDLLLRDRVPTVRRRALKVFATAVPGRLHELFPDVLLDRAPSVRSLARFVAGTHRLGLVPREVYVQALARTMGHR
jgi:hypothetical protein